jgi:hypothetical protein
MFEPCPPKSLKGREAVRRVRSLLWALISVVLASAIAIVPASAATSRAPAPQAPKSDSSNASSLSDNPVIRQFVKTVGTDEIENQNALEAFRAWMFTRPGFYRSGYVGSIDNLRRKSMVLMWYGAPTPFLSAVLREGAGRGIRVTIQHRKYSLQQINAATAAIWKQSAEGKWAGFKISAIVGVTASNSGITVEGTYTRLSASRRAAQVRALATTVSGVSVRVAPGISVTPAAGRDWDTAPFNGGGLMAADNGANQICSSGFAVALNDTPHTTTARHCPVDGGSDYIDVIDGGESYSSVPADERYGTTVELTSSEAGAAAILTSEGSELMFSGPWDNGTGTLSVIGFGDVGVNDLVCTEGGNSGDHCDIKVTAETVSESDKDGSYDTIEAVQEGSGNIAVMAGDSGGPVMTLSGVSSGQVKAAGMIENYGNTLSSCTPAYYANPCSLTVYFTSMRTIVKYTPGLTLVTVNGLISG